MLRNSAFNQRLKLTQKYWKNNNTVINITIQARKIRSTEGNYSLDRTAVTKGHWLVSCIHRHSVYFQDYPEDKSLMRHYALIFLCCHRSTVLADSVINLDRKSWRRQGWTKSETHLSLLYWRTVFDSDALAEMQTFSSSIIGWVHRNEGSLSELEVLEKDLGAIV